jgi:hypothetical protein
MGTVRFSNDFFQRINNVIFNEGFGNFLIVLLAFFLSKKEDYYNSSYL